MTRHEPGDRGAALTAGAPLMTATGHRLARDGVAPVPAG